MLNRLTALVLPVSVALCAASSAFADEDAAVLCAEAEERYVEMFGAPSADAAGVVVVKMGFVAQMS